MIKKLARTRIRELAHVTTLLIIILAVLGLGMSSYSRTVEAAGASLQRVAGASRFETSVLTSQQMFPLPQSAKNVVLASGRGYADALAGVPLAATAEAPVLLTEPSSLPSQTLNEIQRVMIAGGTVFILGGTNAINSAIESQLGSLSFRTERLAGQNRQSTAAIIATRSDQLRGTPANKAYLASANSFADALSVSPLAVRDKAPILLSDINNLSAPASDYLKSNTSISSVTALGGSAVLAPNVLNQVSALGKPVNRIAGNNRYATSKAIADTLLGLVPTPTGVGVVSGENYPDTLGAGVYLGKQNFPLLLTKKDNVKCLETSSYLVANNSSILAASLYGGAAVVAQTSEAELNDILANRLHPICNGASQPFSFTGTGNKVVGPFILEKGLSVITSHHSGSSNFAVVLYDQNGQWVDLVANDIGTYSGESAVGLDATLGYTLDIDADGPWSIDVEQPRPTSATSTPPFSGLGDTVEGAFYLSAGARTFSYSHSGSSNFAVILLDKNGQWVDLIANEIGTTSGSTLSSISTSGIHYLDIDADGTWNISIN